MLPVHSTVICLRKLAICAAILAPAVPAGADMAVALEACLNSDLTIPERAETLRDAGWNVSENKSLMDASLAHGVLFGSLDGLAPKTWGETQSWAADVAIGLRRKKGYDKVVFLLDADRSASLTLEPNRSALATCLYTGDEGDLGPVLSRLDGAIPRTFGPFQAVRGEARKSIVLAYAISPDHAGDFPKPLTYTATFTVVLDRSEGS